MNKRLFSFIVVCCLAGHGNVLSQQPDSLKQKEEMPKLEIPEITIIGKKAITLPFARKGEIYDVELYEAPPPDSSLLGQPPSMSLLQGSLPRYRQGEMPWRFSAEGMLGSFGTVGGRGYLNYVGQELGASGSVGFKHTNGHTTNADASSFKVDGDVHSVVRTDNNALKSFRAALGMDFEHNRYGMFGLPSPDAQRRIDNVGINATLGSLNRQRTVIDVGLGAKFFSLNDGNAGIDSSASVVSPEMRASFLTDVKEVRLMAGILYTGSSLEYSFSTQTPSLLDGSFGMQWRFSRIWSIELGGRFARGQDNNGDERTLTTPYGSGRLEMDSTFAISFWFKPEMQFTSYDSYLRKNPYLVREIAIQPERMPVILGSTFFYNNGPLSLEVRGSFAQSSNAPIQLADSGRILLQYVEATKTALDVEGALQLTNISRLLFSTSATAAYEKGSSTQLPMVPTVRVNGRWETDFRTPIKGWSSVEYLSPRNVDRAGTQSLNSVFLLNLGASTSVIPRVLIAAEVQNLFDINYEWWRGYRAPGIQFDVSAKFNLQ